MATLLRNLAVKTDYLPLNENPQPPERRVSFERILLLLFLLSLPLINPIVHGDGVGYYAYARAPLIQHNLHFEEDWRHANLNFSQSRTRPDGQLLPEQYTETGYVSNLFTIGPAILWFPFLLLAHLLVLLLNSLGMPIAANGFSSPYLVAMALGTAIYGFLGLLLSFSLARKYVGEQWAFLATLGIWWGSSLPVYMYFNPAWSHAHSAFAVALFLWYWDRTRPARTTSQWLILGLISGLMVDIYFPNGVFLLLPLIESLVGYAAYLKSQPQAARKLFLQNLIFVLTICFAFLPTIITRRIIFGGYFRFGSYSHLSWDWSAPHWLSLLVSSNHGLFSWTPLLALALIGLFFTPPCGSDPCTLFRGGCCRFLLSDLQLSFLARHGIFREPFLHFFNPNLCLWPCRFIAALRRILIPAAPRAPALFRDPGVFCSLESRHDLPVGCTPHSCPGPHLFP